MNRIVAFSALLMTMLTFLNIACSFSVEIEITYDWYSNNILMTKFNILPKTNYDYTKVSLQEILADQTIFSLTKNLGNRLLKKEDVLQTFLLTQNQKIKTDINELDMKFASIDRINKSIDKVCLDEAYQAQKRILKYMRKFHRGIHEKN
ncbi:MAG TPA: hypothetical protein VLB80_05225 [Candidatus Babeliales bacterium]|nr:hypothetical protein [Candidatus Babeliales bacterium]